MSSREFKLMPNRAKVIVFHITSLHEQKSTEILSSYNCYLSGFCLHNIGILFIKANGSGRQSICYQIDPQKLNLQLFTITIINSDKINTNKLCR